MAQASSGASLSSGPERRWHSQFGGDRAESQIRGGALLVGLSDDSSASSDTEAHAGNKRRSRSVGTNDPLSRSLVDSRFSTSPSCVDAAAAPGSAWPLPPIRGAAAAAAAAASPGDDAPVDALRVSLSKSALSDVTRAWSVNSSSSPGRLRASSAPPSQVYERLGSKVCVLSLTVVAAVTGLVSRTLKPPTCSR